MPMLGPTSPDRLPITDPLARPIKAPFRAKTPIWACLHWMLHIVLFAGSIAVIFYALVMGRVFIQPEDDFEYRSTGVYGPSAFPPTPTTSAPEDAEGGGDDDF